MLATTAQSLADLSAVQRFDEWVGEFEPVLGAAEVAAQRRAAARRQRCLELVAAIDQRLPIAAALLQRAQAAEAAELVAQVEGRHAELAAVRAAAVEALGFDPPVEPQVEPPAHQPAELSPSSPMHRATQPESSASATSQETASATAAARLAEPVLTEAAPTKPVPPEPAAPEPAAPERALPSDTLVGAPLDQPTAAEGRVATQQPTAPQPLDAHALDLADRRARFVGQLRKARTDAVCLSVWKELQEGLHKLTLADAVDCLTAYRDASERSCVVMPAPAVQLLADLQAMQRSPDGEARYAGFVAQRRDLRVRLGHVQATVAKLHQEAITVETDAVKRAKGLTWHAIAEICCRAKKLQNDYAHELTKHQQHLLHTEVFGRLLAVQKRCALDYVQALKTDWYPEDIVAHIEHHRTERQRLLDNLAKFGVVAPPTPTKEQLLQREQDGQAALADVYRAVTAYEETGRSDAADSPDSQLPQPSAAQDCLRAAVAAALPKLGDYKERLPELMLPHARVFAVGSDFRWLRKQLDRLHAKPTADGVALQPNPDQPNPDQPDGTQLEPAPLQAADDQDGLPPAVVIHGGIVLHPSVAYARRYTQGQRILLVGGLVDDVRRRRIQDDLAAEHVECAGAERSGGLAQVHQAAERIRAGKYDFVVYLLGYLSHKATGILDEAADAAAVPISRVHRGFGVVGIAESICQLARPRAS